MGIHVLGEEIPCSVPSTIFFMQNRKDGREKQSCVQVEAWREERRETRRAWHGLHGQPGIDLIRENLSREGGRRELSKRQTWHGEEEKWRAAGGWVGPRWRRENAAEREGGPD